MARPKKEKFPDKLIRADMVINEKKVTIQYYGKLQNSFIPRLESGELYDDTKHTHIVIVNHEFKAFI